MKEYLPIVAENVWVFSTSRDEGAIRIFVFRRLSLSIDLCLSLRWTRLDLLFQFDVFFPEFRDKVLGLAQLLLNLAVFVFQEIQLSRTRRKVRSATTQPSVGTLTLSFSNC